MKSLSFFYAILSGTLFLLSPVSNVVAEEPMVPKATAMPNVVIVITDDQGYGDLSCHGNPVLKTPNLDSLYKESIRLTDYHVAPTCAPTRASLQSGHWSNRTGVWHTIMGRSMIRKGEPTIGEVFSSCGYATGMFGKWHLGDNFPYRPEDRGYTEVLRHGGGGVGQTPDHWDNAYFDGTYLHNGESEPVKGYCTDVFFDYAKRFIKKQASEGKPFLAYISTNAPHGPFHAPEEFSKPYAKDHKVPLANFYGMIANIDNNVGKLRKFLEEENLAENTIFIFTTDNGTAAGEKVFNAKMRGKKGSQFDGGHRVPFFVHWPANNLTEGRDVAPVTHAVDVLPTLIEMCGIKPKQRLDFDGKSLAGLLRGDDTSGDWDNRVLITDSQRVKDPVMWKSSAVMTSRWRLIDGDKLFDMDSDPSQRRDVAKAYPTEVRFLRSQYQTWWEEIKPSFTDTTRIFVGDDAENPARLTCHDWIAEKSTPWNQASIRKGADAPGVTGYWGVQVTKAGRYKIRLRRWPEETGVGVNEGMKAGEDVPGTRAYRTTPGRKFDFQKASIKIGKISMELPVGEGAKEVVFDVELPRGPTKLTARFHGAEDQVVGAYYAYVEKVNE